MGKRWSPDEDNIIREFYPSEGKDAYKRLKNRTQVACKSRAMELHIYSNNQTYLKKWTEEEDKILKSVYPLKDPSVLEHLFERHTKQACLTRACLLGLAQRSVKPVKCIETNTTYASMSEAAKATNTPADAIWHVCNGDSKTCKGYHWVYTDIK